MEVFQQMAAMGHERVLFCSSPEVGLRAIIAVHSTVLGPGLGGVRMWPYPSIDEALTDVLRLSRSMTYKSAAAGLHLGGGKAVILGDPKQEKSEALLRAFGRYVESLGGLYITAEDVGTDMEDMEHILTETRWVTGVSPAQGGGGDPSPVTAAGVLQGIKAAAAWKLGSPDLASRTVAVQGLGSVGFALAGFLRDEGATVLAADIDGEATARAHDELGVRIVAPAEILDTECDVLAPCAMGAVLDDRTIPRLRCQIVAGAANNQLADEGRDGLALHERGILYAPDFVVNAGGLINVYSELTGYNRETALRMARGLFQNTTRIFELSRTLGIPTAAAAHRVAEDRIASIKAMRPRYWARKVRVMRGAPPA